MFKKQIFIPLVFIISAGLIGCNSAPTAVEVQVTRQVTVEVTREVPVDGAVEVGGEQIEASPTAATPNDVPEEAPEPEISTLPTPVGGGEPEPATESASEQPAAQNAVLRISHPLVWAGDETLDPYAPTYFAEYGLLAYERLIRLDETGNLVPGLATAWEPNGDGTVWTITLRDGVLFHDGETLTAGDVVYSLERMLDPAGNSTLAPLLQSVAAVDPAGDNQITIGLSEPNVEFPLLLTDPRAVILRNGGGESVFSDGIGTGPYQLDQLNVSAITRLVAFEQHWSGRPQIDQIEIISIPDAASRIDAMLAGQIDILNRLEADQKSLFDDANLFNAQTIPTGEWRGFAMRTDTAPFDDPAVRQALRVVADRQAMIDTVLAGAGTVACDQPVWQGDRYWAEISCPQDVELAKSLLAEAGYPDGIEVDLHTSPLDPYWAGMIAVYQEQAAAAGIQVNVIEDPAETFWTNTWLIEPFITTSWNARPAPLILNEAWRSTASWNETYWQNSEFDTLLDSAAAEPDLAKRQALYAQLQDILWESGGAFIPFHLNETRIVSTCVTGVQPVAADHLDFSQITKATNCN